MPLNPFNKSHFNSTNTGSDGFFHQVFCRIQKTWFGRYLVVNNIRSSAGGCLAIRYYVKYYLFCVKMKWEIESGAFMILWFFGIYFIKLGLLVPVCIGVLFCAITALQFLKGQENTRLIESFILSEAI